MGAGERARPCARAYLLFLTSLMFWSLVLEPLSRRRLDYGTALLFVATFGVQNGLLGALLTFAGRPLYVAYLPTTTAWGLTPLEDQQLSGLMMWIPASLIHLGTLGLVRGLDARGRTPGKPRHYRSPKRSFAERGSTLIQLAGIRGSASTAVPMAADELSPTILPSAFS